MASKGKVAGILFLIAIPQFMLIVMILGMLKKVYGDKVKMPFGYFSKTINIGF
jgi:hypothetical protein